MESKIHDKSHIKYLLMWHSRIVFLSPLEQYLLIEFADDMDEMRDLEAAPWSYKMMEREEWRRWFLTIFSFFKERER